MSSSPLKVLPPKKRKLAASTDPSSGEGKKEGGKEDADADDTPIYDESNIGDRIQVYWDRHYKWCVGSKTRGEQEEEGRRVDRSVWSGVWCAVVCCVIELPLHRSSSHSLILSSLYPSSSIPPIPPIPPVPPFRYTGEVTAFTPEGEGVDEEVAGKHSVTYDDGDTKHYCLAKKKFRLIPDVGIRLACNQVHRLNGL